MRIAVLLFMGILSATPSFTHAANKSAPTPAPAALKGEVVIMTAEFLLLRAADGKGVQIPLDKNSRVDGGIHVGATVHATLEKSGHAARVTLAK